MHGTICQMERWSSLANYCPTLQNSGFLNGDLCNSKLLFIVQKVNYLFNYNPAADISTYNPNGIFFRCFERIQKRTFISSSVTWTSRGSFSTLLYAIPFKISYKD